MRREAKRREAMPELRLVLEAGALKELPRAGWARAGLRGTESVADHSWRLALMAVLHAELRGLDAGRAARIAVLHDLAEARVGDRVPGEWSPAGKHDAERRALEAMLAPLPARVRRRCLGLWLDYERGRTPEARLVHELDKLEMAAQALAYEGHRRNARLDGFWASARAIIDDPALRARLDALERRRPR